MANPEHLEKLNEGVAAWNRWRKQNAKISPDLSAASLGKRDLEGVNFAGTDLSSADLCSADLSAADLRYANLNKARLIETGLFQANLAEARLGEADLTGALILEANFSGTELTDTNFHEANVGGGTIFSGNNLAEARGLDTVEHLGPSTISIDTIYLSEGNIPERFLRGAGVPEDFIASLKLLDLRETEYYSCFISYSTKDFPFAEQLHRELRSHNVRCWFAPEDLKIGDRFQEKIEQSIQAHDKLLVVLSKNSINSSWVEREVQAARAKEEESGTTVLFPISLDETFKGAAQAWAADIRRTRQIGDFHKWKDHDSFQKSLDRLLRDLRAQDSKPK
jgi:uncharacterized protein YjbI with pentapeptide repeats